MKDSAMADYEHSQQERLSGDAIEAQIGDVSGGQIAVGKDITQIHAGRDVYSAETITIIYQNAEVAPETIREELSSRVCAHLLQGFLNRLDQKDLPIDTRACMVDEGLKVIYHQGDRLSQPDLRPADIKEWRDQIRNDLEAYRQSQQKSELDPRSQFKQNTLLSRVGLLGQYIEEAKTVLHTALTLFQQHADTQSENPLPMELPQQEVLPEHPYKFLDYFDEKDAAIFFGRTSEIKDVCADVLAHRLTILYAKSGTGKTSLVKAGMIPRLRREGYLVVYARTLQDDPLADVKHAVNACLKHAVAAPHATTLSAFLAQVAERDSRPLILILDQFEEFFLRFSPPVRKNFIGELARVHTANMPVNLVISMREDFFGELSEMAAYIPSTFNNRFRLEPLTEKQARESIEGPVGLFGITYEEGLLEQMIADLSQEGIEPPQLQIVCDRLWHRLPQGHTVISHAMYTQTGGARQILSGYVTEALEEFSYTQERQVAKTILKELVTSQQTKILLDLKSLQEKLAAKFLPDVIEQVLRRLTNCRLVRTLERDDGLSYELAHEYLIETIRGWFDREEAELKQAQEMLDRALADYAHNGSLLSFRRLNIVTRYREHLTWNDKAEALLQRSKARIKRLALGASVVLITLVGVLWFAIYSWQRRQFDAELRLKNKALFPAVDNPENANLRLYFIARDGTAQSIPDFTGKAFYLAAGDYVLEAVKGSYALKYPVYSGGYEEGELKEVAVRFPTDVNIPGDMAYIPAGWFRRGDKDDIGEPDERPPHDVELSAFLIDRREVSDREYAEFSNQEFDGSQGPVRDVTWHEADAYCRWKGKVLPTEAQWEKAARGPEGFSFINGNSYDASDMERPNGYGIANMVGGRDGVWEWVFDRYDEGYYDQLANEPDADPKDPQGPQDGEERVVRGGPAGTRESNARITLRRHGPPSQPYTLRGFRCVVNISN